MTSRSFKPSSLSLRAQRPSPARRSSTSSIKSRDHPSPLAATYAVAASPAEESYFSIAFGSPTDPSPTSSRPIAIQIPPRRKSGHASTPTPPAPLSGRGEKLGGYFPFHEDVKASYKAHPFHNSSSTKSKRNPKDTTPEPRSPLHMPISPSAMDAPHRSESFRATTLDPLLAMMPKGKYHPSNYKNKVVIPEKITPPVPTPSKGHARKGSDVKKKLKQYQREMIQQAAKAGNIQLAGSKPISPRLIPLTSPGPVTPMELEESASYLMARNGVGPNHQEMVAAMIRAEEERDRLMHDGERSPTIAARYR